MLIFRGTLRAAMTLPGRTDKKTGELYKPRDVLQVEAMDSRGLVEIKTITVPNLLIYADKVGQTIDVPVRPWAAGAVVNFMYEAEPA
jgi:hypothetical protein